MSAPRRWHEGAEVAPGVRVYANPLSGASYVRELVLADPRGSVPYVLLAYVYDEAAKVWIDGKGNQTRRVEHGQPQQRVLWFAGPLDRIAGAARQNGRWIPEDAEGQA